ncbi:hypothetical protein INS90_10775 [Trueperella pecoris]|uniref:Uncharacterized protein n=1 Tax=Trueperella pecoris TaxID=2733571 RepID=A0A7M1R0I8_9ACTO|nr:hypothetical protein [Trueperella pecoris]QOR47698.1 hypothetical protein INS90_10775 [Trueperella pecoris]
MDFMEWALSQATKHPELENALVTATDDWLDILLADGRTFRFRPGALIKPDAPLDQREVLLNRLISIGVEQADVATPSEPAHNADQADKTSRDDGVVHKNPSQGAIAPANPLSPASDDAATSADDPGAYESPYAEEPTEDTPVVPIVRSADYFLPSAPDADSMVYLPLTDFLAVGIAYDLPDSTQPIYYEQLADEGRELGEIMSEAVLTLRLMTNENQQTVELGSSEIAGARVITFLQPPNYELSWFADVDMIQQLAERITADHPDDIPLFVPASRTKLFIVFADDPHLVDFFKLLLTQRESPDAVYPLPHTVAADGWLEWQPFPGSELAEVLGALRNHFRERIYSAQEQMMKKWAGFGEVKTFVPRRIQGGERVSTVTWDAGDKHGTVPVTDFVTFTRSASPHPWEDATPVNITVRTHVAREIWPEGFSPDETVWPPRLVIDGFPDDETLALLIDASGRRF